MKAVIPAAGLGTRFLPATKAQPKEMLPVVDKPTIQYVVEEAIASDIDDILIVTDKRKKAIEDHFDRSFDLEDRLKKRGMNDLADAIKKIGDAAKINYVRQKESNGLGDAVYQSRNFVENGSFAVLLGDDIIISEIPVTKQLMNLNKKYNAPIIAVEKIPKQKINKYGIIDIKEEIDNGTYILKDLVEKPSLKKAPSDYGIVGRYILVSDIFDSLEKIPKGVGGEYQLTDAIKYLLKDQDVYAYEFSGKRYDVGTIPEWIIANVELSRQNPKYSKEINSYFKTSNKPI
ncbi:MAG: UTP--glucose-1-phosphate uridylyltransferase GalU [Candidatus Aenigmarchaeota archaeon]|nr:UTP--glucose-1-phosphate uridylyltransferase GalU [Candidatus Aenigmarchaeota archaeon]